MKEVEQNGLIEKHMKKREGSDVVYMTNKEKYAKDILDIVCEGSRFALYKGEIVRCDCIENCRSCAFSKKNTGLKTCGEGIKRWANKEYEEFKPCPFCGGEKVTVQYLVTRPYITCEKCHAQIPCYNTYQEAKEAWNRRVDNNDSR